jgi:hypothetical protein
MKKKQSVCIGCWELLEFVIDMEEKQVPVCHRIDCKYYWLLQLWQDVMDNILLNKKKDENK